MYTQVGGVIIPYCFKFLCDKLFVNNINNMDQGRFCVFFLSEIHLHDIISILIDKNARNYIVLYRVFATKFVPN